jgi:hypothetical protein
VSARVETGKPIEVGPGPWVLPSDTPWAVFPVAMGETLRVVVEDKATVRPAPIGFEGRVASRGTSPQGPWVALQSATETWPRSGAPVTHLVRVACCARVGGDR